MIWLRSAQRGEVQHEEQTLKDLLVMIYKGTTTLTTQLSCIHIVTYINYTHYTYTIYTRALHYTTCRHTYYTMIHSHNTHATHVHTWWLNQSDIDIETWYLLSHSTPSSQ